MNKYVIEFIGTYFLMLVIVLTVNILGQSGYGEMTPLAIGLALTALVYAGGHISLAHYNPAVTIAFWICGKCKRKDVAPYIIAQVSAAILASLTASLIFEVNGSGGMILDPIKAVTAEFLGTFLLVFVILNVAIAKGTANNSFYGIAIGFVVGGMAYTLGGFSGGAFNPAVGIGLSLSNMSLWSNVWIFLIICTLAGIAAAYTFKMTAKIEDQKGY